MKISQEALLAKKIFFASNKSRRWENGFPTIFEKKNFSGWHMKISQGAIFAKKNFFFIWNEFRIWENGFPPIFEKKIFLRLVHKNS